MQPHLNSLKLVIYTVHTGAADCPRKLHWIIRPGQQSRWVSDWAVAQRQQIMANPDENHETLFYDVTSC
jgi:hypothetical protein